MKINANEILKIIKAKRMGRSLVPLQIMGTAIPFFTVPGILYYRELSNSLGNEQPFYCFEPLENKLVFECAQIYIKELREIQPKGPYKLGAYCIDGNLMLEVGRQLLMQHEQVSLMVLFEAYSPTILALSAHYGGIGRKLLDGNLNGVKVSTLMGSINKDLLVKANERKNKYPGDIILIRSKFRLPEIGAHAYMGWSDFVSGNIETFEIEGDHFNILKPPFVQDVSKILRDLLERITA